MQIQKIIVYFFMIIITAFVIFMPKINSRVGFSSEPSLSRICLIGTTVGIYQEEHCYHRNKSQLIISSPVSKQE